MSSEREALRLHDIIDNIDRIFMYLDGVEADEFGDDQKTVDAVERCLQRVTEAVIKVGEERMREIAPTLPVHAVRGLGNVLRQEYDGINYEMVWETVTNRLPVLRADCAKALSGGG